MGRFYDAEKREFVRVDVSVPVAYKFISQDREREVPTAMLAGQTRNIGAGGILLAGDLPEPGLISDLLMHKVVVGVRIDLPGEDEPAQAIARVSWIESVGADNRCGFGLAFKEITSETQNALFRFIINTRMG